MAYADLLKSPPQRRLLLASIPADFADWLDYVAIVALLVYSWHQGPFVLALFALALTLPYILVGPLLAALIDRSDLKTALVLSNAGRAVTTLLLIIAPNTAIVLVLVFLRGAIDSAFTPARQSAIQLITPPDLLMAANGAHQGINQTSKIVGPAVGGLLLAVLPTGGVFAVNAALSVLAVTILLGLKLPSRPTGIHEQTDVAKELTAGFVEFTRSRKLLATLILAASAYFAFFLYDTLIALLAAGFGLDPAIFGISIAASGAGGVIGSLLGGAVKTKRPIAIMALGALVSAPITAGLGWLAMSGASMPTIGFLAAMAVMGGSTAFMLVPYRSIIQQETPPDRIARVFAAGEAVTMAVMLSAPFIGSAIASAYGTGAAFIAGGLLLCLIGIVALIAGLRR